MAKRIRGLTVSIGANTDNLRKALEPLDKNLKEINKDLAQVNKALKLDSSSADIIAQKQSLLNKEIEQTNQKLQILKKTRSDMERDASGNVTAENMKAINYEVANAEAQLKKFKTQLKEIKQIKLTEVSEEMKKIGKNMTRYVTLPITAGLTLATKSAIDFESAFTGVRKTVDATEAQFTTLEKGIRNLALEIPTSATELAKVGEIAGQLGIHVDDILEFTKVMVNLGVATNMSAEDAATALARFSNIMGTSSADYERLGATIVDLGNNFATTESEIVEMSLRIAGAGKTIGLSEANVMSLAAALSSVGIEAEMGGSAISKAMIKMAVAVETNNGSLKDFAKISGMSTKEFKRAFEEDAMSALSAFIIGLGNTEKHGKSTLLLLEELGFSEVRLRDTMLRAANASDIFNDAVTRGNTAWKESSALQTEAEKRYATTESQIALTKNQLIEFGISIGNTLIPKLQSLLKTFSGFFEWLNKLNPSTKNYITNLGLMLVVTGPLINGIGKMITTFKTLSTTMSISKLALGGIVTGIIALIPLLMNLKNATDEGSKAQQEFLDRFKSTEDIINEVNSNMSDMENQTNESMKKIRFDIISTIDSIERTVDKSKTKDKWKDLIGSLTAAYETQTKAINATFAERENAVLGSYDSEEEKTKKLLILSTERTKALDVETEAYNKSTKELEEILGKNFANIDKLTEEQQIKAKMISYDYVNSFVNTPLDIDFENSGLSKTTLSLIESMKNTIKTGTNLNESEKEAIKTALANDAKSIVDNANGELEKLKTQLDAGLITPEIFELKKSQLNEIKTRATGSFATLSQMLEISIPAALEKMDMGNKWYSFMFSESKKQEMAEEGAAYIDYFLENVDLELNKSIPEATQMWEIYTKKSSSGIPTGFEKGNPTSKFYAKGVEDAKAYTKGFQKEMKIKSPSRAMVSFGQDTKKGFEIGNPNEAYKMWGSQNAEAYLSGLENTVAKADQLSNSMNIAVPSTLSNTTSNVSKNLELNIYTNDLSPGKMKDIFNYVDQEYSKKF